MTKTDKYVSLKYSSVNVFADLELDDADELVARDQFGFQVWKILKAKTLKQYEMTELLGVKQPKVSHLISHYE